MPPDAGRDHAVLTDRVAAVKVADDRIHIDCHADRFPDVDIAEILVVLVKEQVGEAHVRSSDDIVLIHDAIRPMVSAEIISDNIRVAREYGNAITVIPCAEAMMETEDGKVSVGSYPRDRLKRTQTPQAFRIGDICDLHRRALAAGITNSVASCTLKIEMGEQVYFSSGSEKNIKLTTVEDIDIFKALLAAKRSDWLKD